MSKITNISKRLMNDIERINNIFTLPQYENNFFLSIHRAPDTESSEAELWLYNFKDGTHYPIYIWFFSTQLGTQVLSRFQVVCKDRELYEDLMRYLELADMIHIL